MSLNHGLERVQVRENGGSIYLRLCNGKEQFETYARRIEQHLPEFGKVHLVAITDKQYENIIRYSGRARRSAVKNPGQLALF